MKNLKKVLYKCETKTEFDRVRTLFNRLGVKHEIRQHCIIADPDSINTYTRLRKKDGIKVEHVNNIQVDRTGTTVYL